MMQFRTKEEQIADFRLHPEKYQEAGDSGSESEDESSESGSDDDSDKSSSSEEEVVKPKAKPAAKKVSCNNMLHSVFLQSQ